MKNLIALAQLNPIVGNIEYNKEKAIENIKKALEKGAEMVIFPELFLIGSPVYSIIERFPHVLKQCETALKEIAKQAQGIDVLIGYGENKVAYIKQGKIEKIFKKNSFEDRIIEFNTFKASILIGDEDFNKISPSEVVIHLDSSISRTNKEQLRNEFISNFVKENNVKYVWVNQAGANDEFVYDGLSRLVNEKGEILARACAFEEDLLIIDLINGGIINPILKGLETKPQLEFSLDYSSDLERTYLAILCAIKNYFQKNGLKQAVLGLSGGLDSTICAVLLVDALGKENVLGVSMPSKITSDDSKSDAEKLANNLGINFIEVPIKKMHECISNELDFAFNKINWSNRYVKSYTQDNIQARSRATILFGIANEFSSTIPIATSDKSESYMGYATINGDMSGGFAPIIDVVKTKLFALGRWMNENRAQKNAIPKSILEKPPGAELAINPDTGKTLTAEEALMPYEFLDEVIWRIENFKQTIDDMMKAKFLYEKKNGLSEEQKRLWLEKFFKRMKSALFKWYISTIGPITDAHSINKAEFHQAITSQIKID